MHKMKRLFCAVASCLATLPLACMRRKPDKSETEEPLEPCPYCSNPVPQTKLDCPQCKSNIPYCIDTVSHLHAVSNTSYCYDFIWMLCTFVSWEWNLRLAILVSILGKCIPLSKSRCTRVSNRDKSVAQFTKYDSHYNLWSINQMFCRTSCLT